MTDFLNEMISVTPVVKERLGDVKCNDMVSIEFTVDTKHTRFYHKGIYILEFSLLEGLYYYNIGIVNETDENYGISQWLLR